MPWKLMLLIEETVAEFEAEASKLELLQKQKAEAESKRLQGQGIADQEEGRGLVESVDVLNRVGINSQNCVDCGYTTLRYGYWLLILILI
jgi:hypothetical protein